jgi:hypothetical protein
MSTDKIDPSKKDAAPVIWRSPQPADFRQRH